MISYMVKQEVAKIFEPSPSSLAKTYLPTNCFGLFIDRKKKLDIKENTIEMQEYIYHMIQTSMYNRHMIPKIVGDYHEQRQFSIHLQQDLETLMDLSLL